MLRAQNNYAAVDVTATGSSVLGLAHAMENPDAMTQPGAEIPTPIGYKSTMGAPQPYGHFGVPGHGEQFARVRGPAGKRITAKIEEEQRERVRTNYYERMAER
jgi:hypothetical protein